MVSVAHGDVEEGASETRSLLDLGLDVLIHLVSERVDASEACGLAVSVHVRLEPPQSHA